jgi:hypothetical protein
MGRFEPASESKVKNAEQIVLYALGFLCFSQKLSGKIFDLCRFCVFPCFLDVGVIKSMNDCDFRCLSGLVKGAFERRAADVDVSVLLHSLSPANRPTLDARSVS